MSGRRVFQKTHFPMAKVEMLPDAPGCWLWTGALFASGYGYIAAPHRELPNDRKTGVRAHRLMWELLHGPVPEGLCVCHHCDVKLCVRPDHLFLGTHEDNMADKVAKDRQARGSATQSNTKLTSEIVTEIRSDRTSTDVALARRHGVNTETIRCARKRLTWKHVSVVVALLLAGPALASDRVVDEVTVAATPAQVAAAEAEPASVVGVEAGVSAVVGADKSTIQPTVMLSLDAPLYIGSGPIGRLLVEGRFAYLPGETADLSKVDNLKGAEFSAELQRRIGRSPADMSGGVHELAAVAFYSLATRFPVDPPDAPPRDRFPGAYGVGIRAQHRDGAGRVDRGLAVTYGRVDVVAPTRGWGQLAIRAHAKAIEIADKASVNLHVEVFRDIGHPDEPGRRATDVFRVWVAVAVGK